MKKQTVVKVEFDMIRSLADVHKKLTALFTPPVVLNQLDDSLYRCAVAAQVKKVSDATLKETREEVIDVYNLEDAIEQCPESQTITLATGDYLLFTLQKKKAATKLNTVTLINELRKAGVSLDVINAAMDAATSTNAPAKTFTAIPR